MTDTDKTIDGVLTHPDDIHGELRGMQNDPTPEKDQGQGDPELKGEED